LILATLEEKGPAADSRLRLMMDDEACNAAGRVNRAMLRWIKSREAGAGGDNAK
jgi:hypothetical protein